jgi:hypothetical protein
VLDPTFAPTSDGFLGALARTQRHIVDQYTAEYVTALESTGTPLLATIPWEYSERTLQSNLYAISLATDELERLHRHLCRPLASYDEWAATRAAWDVDAQPDPS